MNIRRLAAIPALIATGALALAGCAGTGVEDSTNTEAKKVQVLAAFYPLQFLAQKVGGDFVSVESLTPAGGEPHDLELSPADVAKVGKAGLVVYIDGFQPAVDKAVEQSKPKAVLDAAKVVKLTPATAHEEGAGHDHGAEAGHDHGAEAKEAAQPAEAGHDHAAEAGHDHGAEAKEGAQPAEAGHDHGAEAGHDHGALDPHFWLNPNLMADMATALGAEYAKIDPAHAAQYQENAKKTAAEMKGLGDKFVAGTKTCTKRTFVTAHAAFGYLADLTKLEQVGVAGIDSEATTSPQRLAEVSRVVKAKGVTTIFAEALLNPKDVEALAKEHGIKVEVLDPVESQADPNKDYIAVMETNLANLQGALSCK